MKPKVRDRLHNISPLVLILSHINLIHILPSHFLRSNLIIFHPRLGFQEFLFRQVSSPKPYMYLFAPHICYMRRLSHPLCLDYPNVIWGGVQIMKPLITQFSPIPSYFLPLAHISPHLNVSNNLSLCSSQEWSKAEVSLCRLEKRVQKLFCRVQMDIRQASVVGTFGTCK